MGSVTIAELLSWQPGKLDGVSDKLNTRRKSLVDLQDEIDATKPPSDWKSDAGNAARTAHVKLRDDLNDMAAEIAKVVLGLDVASTNIATAKTELQGQLDHARTLKCTVDHQTGNVTGPSEEDDPDGEVTQAQVNSIARGISDALTDAGNADADLATVMNAARTDKIDGGTGTLADANALKVELAGVTRDEEFYKETLGKRSTQEQIDWVNQHKGDLPPAAAAALSTATQEHFAHETAEAIKAPGTVDSDTVRLMTFLQDQQAFAHGLYSEVTPREMASELEDFNNDVFPDPGPGRGVDGDQLKTYKAFLNSAGHTLATYSSATGPFAPPGGPKQLAEDWYRAITDGDHEQDASALTLLVRAGGHEAAYDPTFMGNLTGKVYEWERGQDGKVWGPRDHDTMWDPNNPPHMVSNYQGYGGGTTYSYQGGIKATDGLANLLGGMEHSPKAAQDFFMGRYDGSSGGVEEHMDYLVGGGDARTWDGEDNSDDGDGLGLALQAATVGEDTRTADGTSIASQLFQNIGEHGGKGDGTWTHEWHVGPRMTDSLGLIASGYTGDLYDELSGSGAQSGPTHLDLGDDPSGTLKNFLGELGRNQDKSGLETLTSAMMMQTKAEYGDQLGAVQGPHDLDHLTGAGLEGQQQRSGKVMGMLLKDGLALSDNQDQVAEQRAAIMSKAIDVTAGFVPGLGDGASELSKMTFDTLKGETIEGLKGALESKPSTDDYLDGSVMKLDQKLQYTAIDSLIENGYLGAQHSETFGAWDGISPDVLVGEPPHQHLDPRLYDNDGHQIDTSKMSDAERAAAERTQNAWSAYNESPESDVVLGLTGQSEFTKYFTDPTLEYTK